MRSPARGHRRLLSLLLILTCVACGGGEISQEGSEGAAAPGVEADVGDDAVAVAERYFTALAAADYDVMAATSTGLANTAARYGQQVTAADPEAFEARDLQVVEQLAEVAGSDVLAGALDLTTKGDDTRPLRISGIGMTSTDDGWLVSDYARAGRPLSEVFRDVDIDITTDEVRVRADVVLTDPVGQVLLVPLAITAADDSAVTIDARATRPGGFGPPAEIEGADTVPAGEERWVALVFRDVADPAGVETVPLVLTVDRQEMTVELPIGAP